MNIIKKGHIYPYKGTCETCGSELECTKAEVRLDRVEACEYEQVAACPVCLKRGEKVNVIFRLK